MYIKITEKFLTICAIVALFTCAMLPSFIGQLYFFNMTRFGVVALIGAILFNNKRLLSWKVIFPIIIYVIFCHNNLYQQLGNMIFLQYTVCLGVVLISLVSTTDWTDLFLKGTTIIGLVHAVSTIILRFTPSIYYGVIAPLYPSTYSRLISWYAEGCMAGLTAHYSINGIYMAAGLFTSVALSIKYYDKYKIKVFFIPLLFIVGLLLTGKRAHLFFSLIVLYAFYYLYLSNDKRTRLIKMIGIALIVAFIGIIIITYSPSLATAFTRMQLSMEEGDVTNNRTYFWGLALLLFVEHPFIGIGWGQFLEYSELMLNYRANVHNNYLQLLCETGALGFAAYIIWMLFYFIKSIVVFVKIREKTADATKVANIAFSFMYQMFFIMYCFTGNPLYDKETFIPYFLSCAIINFEYRKMKEELN